MRIYTFIILFFMSFNAQSKSLVEDYYFVNSTWSPDCSENYSSWTYKTSLLNKAEFDTFSKAEKSTTGKILEIDKLSPDPLTGWERIKIKIFVEAYKTGTNKKMPPSQYLEIWAFDPLHYQRKLIEAFDLTENSYAVKNGMMRAIPMPVQTKCK